MLVKEVRVLVGTMTRRRIQLIVGRDGLLVSY